MILPQRSGDIAPKTLFPIFFFLSEQHTQYAVVFSFCYIEYSSCSDSPSNHSCGLLRLMNLKFIFIKDPYLASILCYKMQKKTLDKMNENKIDIETFLLFFSFPN